MSGIPAELMREVRGLLLACDEFHEPRWLRAVMGSELLRPWQDRFPEASSAAERVDRAIDYLSDKQRSTGENGLVLLLRVLADPRDPGDARKGELLAAADRLEAGLAVSVKEAPGGRVPVGESGSGRKRRVPAEFERALAANLAARTLVLCLGADLPQAITGVPPRDELLRGMGSDSHEEFVARLRDSLGGGLPPAPFYHRLAELIKLHGLRTVLTTASDDRLESALREINLPLTCKVRGRETGANSAGVTLIRLYGMIEAPETLVVTEAERAGLLQEPAGGSFLEPVRRAMQKNTLLFLGCNPTGPDFQFLVEGVAGGPLTRTAYAIWPELPETAAQRWRSRGIWILETDPWGLLG